MTNLAHWQDDIDDALGGDFDGSLSGLCIMSLSFDFTRNGGGTHLGSSRENNSVANAGTNHQSSNGLLGLGASSDNKRINYGININHDSHNNDNNDNCFSKRLKTSITTGDNDDENRSNNQNKIVRHLQQLKNCLNTTSLNTNNTPTTHYSTQSQTGITGDPDSNQPSPQSSEVSCNRASALSTPNDSSRSSTVGARSPSPSQSCSSISTNSHTSSRSQSPSDMSLHSCNNNNNTVTRNNPGNVNSNLNGSNKIASNQSEPRGTDSTNDNQQVSVYSVKDSLLNGGTLKESSYTTSVITTTAPMHFKSLHHPFPIKQFPLSPYHQFSNSSLNHDSMTYYDRYLSHDSHQPLQTPLIGIERTQDLLSLKLPPHGPEDIDSQRFSKEWSFEETKHDNNGQNRLSNNGSDKHSDDGLASNLSVSNSNQDNTKRKESGSGASSEGALQKGFPFNYKINSSVKSNNDRVASHGPIDLNVSYDQEGCCSNDEKNDIFNESMKHFNPDRVQQDERYDLRSKNNSPNQTNNHGNDGENVANLAHQYHGQESMFGIDPSKQKFQYVLAAPISVATKLIEDTMTYLNQGQAYEIKLENTTDVAEAKKGFMCSIINIGFHERHMQQAENELWQQWSQQHPNEKIFSVDMKLSYNVFGVESDGLNKYEFLWDSSKAAGVFIRINSISTEFTPKKHGGEKGVPFKLSIETFSYNSKTHDSYFITAACCQIKVFKPKGAERKIRSDRDKVSKRPPSEQDKYHRSSDHTTFKECSLASLHPMADGLLCYYRHSHGHFASKQVVTTTSVGGTPSTQTHQTAPHQSDDDIDHVNNASQHNQSPDHQSSEQNRTTQVNNDSETSNGQSSSNQRGDYQNHGSRNIPLASKNNQSDYSATRLTQTNHYGRSNLDNSDHTDHGYVSQPNQHSTPEPNFSHSNELLHLQQPNAFNQMYHNNQMRGVAGLAGINNSQHFGIAYYGHTLPTQIPPHNPPSVSYGLPTSNALTNISHSNHGNHNFPISSQQHIGTKGASSIYRHEKQIGYCPTSQGAAFKASNLALTSHNNFQTYLGNHSDQCAETPSQDLKDGTQNNGNYQHDNYDSHLHHSFHSSGSHGQQQPFRQRSASTSLTTTNSHCANYMGHGNQGRHLESYAGPSSALLDNTMTNNHWNHGPTNNSQLTSPNSVCTQRGSSNIMGPSHDASAYNNGHNYESSNHQYDSDHNSPHKNHAHTSDSSSSCYSRFKNNSSIMPSNAHQADSFETARMDSHSSHITVNSNCTEVVTWLTVNRFEIFTKTFNNFSGSDLLRLSKTELIEICGLIDGIRLYNCLHNQPIKPRRVLYICHKDNEIFHPIYLYDVTLKELLQELSTVFSSYFPSSESQLIDDKHQKGGKSMLNSSSSTDSRSSIGALSTETGADEVYGQSDSFFSDIEIQRQGKSHATNLKSANETISHVTFIDRLLIEGITSVKIVATEQVVQMLEDESVWTLSFTSGNPRLVEVCISACHSKRTSK